ncbi:hypothetical protein D3C75_595810 [compost metagenome]
MNDLVGTFPEFFGGEAGTGNGFVVHEVEQDFGDLQATDLNVFSHCLPHSAQLFRFSALQFNNEAFGHLNHKPLYQYMPTTGGWVGTNQRLGALLTGLSGLRTCLRQTSIQRYVVRAAAYYMMNCGCEN